MTASTLRLFFALVPDASMRAALGRLAADVASRARGRATAAANLHLTLAFLGEMPASAVPALQAIGGALPREGFDLALDRIGSFRGSGVAWIAARETPPALLRLHAALASALAVQGFPSEARVFRAHVTLARKCEIALRESLPVPLGWPVREIALVASTLAPGGSVYRALSAWPLAAP